MNIPDRLTFVRLFLAPVFFILYILPIVFPEPFSGSAVWLVPLLWVIFIVSEITDMLDGIAARRLNQSSDLGKLLDPFADTIMQITCFLCYVIDGIFPVIWAVLFLVVLYREFGILLIRNLMLKKGIAMGASMGGKIKTVTYIAAAAIALLYASLLRLDAAENLQPVVKIAALAVFGVSVLFSVLSFFDYLSVFRSKPTRHPEEPQ